MKLFTVLFLSALLLGCASEGPRRTGVVAADGSIVWDAPAYVATQPLANALSVAGAYYAGRAQGYQNYSAQHGTATVIVPGQATGFIYY